ncbi:amino acid adenylation domain-containing protein [Amycolatopsis sp. CA-230715]|uniref:amino acid adenylation domain-containing protein n=1 Tax=Amycolatopsis sp. CA-230715 TaxID=2745196 RepID=UPI001C00E010|nr:amino acid adenylation domain-containing protein [Amycolatopsis sp. CA-230715]QWF84507.1 Gramicidin S synthase 2 [Amycolatopsis sp. CA-230715]
MSRVGAEPGMAMDTGMLVPDRVAALAARQPDAVAIGSGGHALTYAELHDAATTLASELVARGVGPEVCVALCFERSSALVIAMLAVLEAGGFYLPLDPEYPAARLELMVRESDAVLVLGDQRSLALLPEDIGVPAVPVRDDGRAGFPGVTAPAVVPRAAVSPGNTAYVVYTSGSTGAPKGVVVTHSALRWFVENLQYAEPGTNDVVALASSPSFDALAFECWVALTRGARLHVVPRPVLLSPSELARSLRAGGVTMMYVTAALLQQLAVETPQFAAGLRILFFGGQRADHRSVLLVREKSAPARLVQVYGPTETTIWSSYQDVDEGGARGWIPLGEPIAGTTEYLLDAGLHPVPPGTPGEIYIGGDGVVRGYLGRPDLTAERFLPDPFRRGEPAARMYRTGDLARRRQDGSLEFLGRADGQVKIRGFRIELGEIELALTAHPEIAAAVVTVVEVPGGPQLIAHYVPEAGALPAKGRRLREFLAERMPPYMVPALYLPLERIPLAPNGKIDRPALVPPLTPDGRIDRRRLATRGAAG